MAKGLKEGDEKKLIAYHPSGGKSTAQMIHNEAWLDINMFQSGHGNGHDVPVWEWDVKGEAFGNTAPDQDPDGDANAFVIDMRFPWQRFDEATGKNYNYYPDNDPSIGLYIQSDP